ncbi:nucleotidyltransferase family protein [Nitrobacter sp. JJSN]|jgi:MurNAc alpha-1-phosphate uridylyltransferase|uniref:nucleotidyltransferase family protein n=1 Tax=Nitrobacter sp. JJSN TaxID=3453033 RepID=UPI003F765543
MPVTPTKAMVLAAGLGLRMRPLTERMPKPMVPVAGKPLLDHVLDKLADAGVGEAVVNVRYLPDQIIDHVAHRTQPRIIISDERNEVLGTGGAVVKALPLLGETPFFHLNADTMWIDGARPNLTRMAEAFDSERMDILLLMAPTASSIGYGGSGDYAMLPDGALRKRKENQVVPFVYAGVAIISPALFAGTSISEFSLTKIFDRANEQERLFGLRLEGVWMHVGTPDAVKAAEQAVLVSAT